VSWCECGTTKYLRLWPFWLSAHLIAMARRIEATYGTYYVDSDPGRTLALSVALKNELPNLELFCEATRQQVARARVIDQGEARVVPRRGRQAGVVPCFHIENLAGS
jgi:hypothetical protein